MAKRRCVVRRATAEEELERLAVCKGGVMRLGDVRYLLKTGEGPPDFCRVGLEGWGLMIVDGCE